MSASSISAYELMNAFYMFNVATKPPTSDVALYFAILSKWNICKRPESFTTTKNELKALTGLKDTTLRDSLKRLESKHIIHTQQRQGVEGLRISMNREANWQYAAKCPRPVKGGSNSRARAVPENLKPENQTRVRNPDETPIIEVIERSVSKTSKYAGMSVEEMIAFRKAEKASKPS